LFFTNQDNIESSEAKLQALSRDAFAQGINPAKIYDAGKTQLEPSTFTALGIGPAPSTRLIR